MRVLIDTEHLGIVGGVETYLRAVLPRLVAAGFEVGVVAANADVTGDGITSGCPEAPVWRRAGRRIAELLPELDRWRPDVVYSHGTTDPAWEAALTARFPAVLFAHNYHGTCVSGTKCHSRPGFEVCRRTLGPGCLAHYLPRGCGGNHPLTMLRLYAGQRRRLGNLVRYEALLVASRHMADEYRRHGMGDDRLRLVPLFPTDIAPDPDPPLSRSRSDRILFVGRVTRLKGLDHLITAVAQASAELGRRLTLVVAGTGPESAAAEAQARRAGVPCEFLGWADPSRREAEMRAADVLGVPSVWPEPFGLVGLEAACVGLPAVGYATGGIPDWLASGESGESASGDRPDPREFAAALVRALSDDDHLHRLRVGAWKTARRFTAQRHLTSITSLLRKHAGAPRRTAG